MQVLDVCCGSKMFWYDKNNPNVTFMDNRQLKTTLCDGRLLEIKPDIVGDFRNIPFANNFFSVVVFDPPHLIHLGHKSWLALKYGKLESSWRADIRQGFTECFRVLKLGGILIFKWSEAQIPIKEILSLAEREPLVREQKSKRHWIIFLKEEKI